MILWLAEWSWSGLPGLTHMSLSHPKGWRIHMALHVWGWVLTIKGVLLLPNMTSPAPVGKTGQTPFMRSQ